MGGPLQAILLRIRSILSIEAIGHVEVVVLTGVNDQRVGPAFLFQGMVERLNLHEIGFRRSGQMNLHRSFVFKKNA